MKMDYFYDEQFRRTLKHLIRLFSEIQVVVGYDNNNEPKYRTVPCRYADFAKDVMYIQNGNSENVMQSAPIITLSVNSLKMDRKGIRGTVEKQTIVGTNQSPAVNEYNKKLDQIHEVRLMNPIPWDLVFNLNIWCTSLTTKMQIWEQIITLFNPSVELQLNENPLDWTSLSTVELIDSNFSTRSFPQGTDDSLDISTLTFKTTIYFSLPAIVSKPKLIEQIVTNMKFIHDELDIDNSNLITDVYTPKNLSIKVDKLSRDDYKLTLLDSAMSTGSNGEVYSWVKYFEQLNKDYRNKDINFKLLRSVEDPYPINANLISMSSEHPNELTVQIDSSQLNITHTIDGFVNELIDEKGTYINISEEPLIYTLEDDSVITVKPNEIFEVNDKTDPDSGKTFMGVTVLEYENGNIIYNSEDSVYYMKSKGIGWNQIVLSVYRAGY